LGELKLLLDEGCIWHSFLLRKFVDALLRL
jgi:hypothetical protein